MFKDRGEVSVAGVEKIRKRVGKNKALPPPKKNQKQSPRGNEHHICGALEATLQSEGCLNSEQRSVQELF